MSDDTRTTEPDERDGSEEAGQSPVAIVSITRLRDGRAATDQDLVAVESPVGVEVRRPGESPEARSLGILMRTPGHDEELVLGLLHGEGVIRTRDDVLGIRREHRADEAAASGAAADVIEVDLAETADVAAVASRALSATSACGLCGRLELQSGPAAAVGAAGGFALNVIARLPDLLRSRQAVFAETGGLHAAALFDRDGTCLVIREDVGRHNAVDKVVGWALTAGRLPACDAILAVSGRVAFEIVQKAARAGIPVLVAVGAPSSLAVEAARAARLTLVGFVREGRLNVYTLPERLTSGPDA